MIQIQEGELEERFRTIDRIKDEKLKEIEEYSKDLTHYEMDIKEEAKEQIMINHMTCTSYISQIYSSGNRVIKNTGEKFGYFCEEEKEENNNYLRKVERLNHHIERMESVIRILKNEKLRKNEIIWILKYGNY